MTNSYRGMSKRFTNQIINAFQLNWVISVKRLTKVIHMTPRREVMN